MLMLTPQRYEEVNNLITIWDEEHEEEESIWAMVQEVLRPPPGTALWSIVETSVKLKEITAKMGITLHELQYWDNQHTSEIKQWDEDRTSVHPDHA